MLIRVLLAAVVAASALAQFPGKTWEKRRSAEWSQTKLEEARRYAATIGAAAVMIVQRGAVVDEWGETARRFNCHSIRKSLLSALYGIHAAEGAINLKAKLADLGIDDNGERLTDVEKSATVADLLKARSGIYHPALYETAGMKAMRPARGSHKPGRFWYYNNWDFNTLGTIFEKAAGAGIFVEFAKHIAAPLEMEDYTAADGEYFKGPDSIHPAYPFRMTARDLARFGLLYLKEGKWNGRQIVPAAWIRESTRRWTDLPEYGRGEGYGYMWWIHRDGYSARGAGGHVLLIVPKLDLVIVHRVNTDEPGREVSGGQFERLARMICGAPGGT